MKLNPTYTTPLPVDANVRIGHVHLKVADLERSLAFYRDVLGLEVTQRFGSQATFDENAGLLRIVAQADAQELIQADPGFCSDMERRRLRLGAGLASRFT